MLRNLFTPKKFEIKYFKASKNYYSSIYNYGITLINKDKFIKYFGVNKR